MAHYFDTSALVKLVVAEPETGALRAWLAEAPREPVSSDVTRTELMRAVRRIAPDLAPAAREVLNRLTLMRITSALCDRAALLEPVAMRSLDALHLAAALDLGDDVEGFVAYDRQLARSATLAGLNVVAPQSRPQS